MPYDKGWDKGWDKGNDSYSSSWNHGKGGRGSGSSRAAPYPEKGKGAPGRLLHGNLYVANFPPRHTDSDLADMFSSYGMITSCKVNAPGGTGFVRFKDLEHARRAIEEMHGQEGLVVRSAHSDTSSNDEDAQEESKHDQGASKGDAKVVLNLKGDAKGKGEAKGPKGEAKGSKGEGKGGKNESKGCKGDWGGKSESTSWGDSWGGGSWGDSSWGESWGGAKSSWNDAGKGWVDSWNEKSDSKGWGSWNEKGDSKGWAESKGGWSEKGDGRGWAERGDSWAESWSGDPVDSGDSGKGHGYGKGSPMAARAVMRPGNRIWGKGSRNKGAQFSGKGTVSPPPKPGGGSGVGSLNNRLLVKQLSEDTDEAALAALFNDAGFATVSCKRAPGARTAMVILSDPEVAAAAAKRFNGTDPFGTGPLEVTVPLAKAAEFTAKAAATKIALTKPPQLAPSKARPGAAGRIGPSSKSKAQLLSIRFAGSEEPPVPSESLYLSNLPSPQLDLKSVAKVFEDLGLHVQQSRIVDNHNKGLSAATVQVTSLQEAQKAIDALEGRDVWELGFRTDGDDWPPATVTPPPRPARPVPPNGGGYNARPAWATGPGPSSSGTRPVFRPQKLNQMGSSFPTPELRVPAKIPPAPSRASPSSVVPPKSKGDPRECLIVEYAGSAPSADLFVQGLPSPSVDEGFLKELFSGFRVVRCASVEDNAGRGYSEARVTLGSAQEAGKAIAALNGIPLNSDLEPLGPQPEATSAKSAPSVPSVPSVPTVPPVPPVPPSIAGRLPEPPEPPPKNFRVNVQYAGNTGPSDSLYVGSFPVPQVDPKGLSRMFEQAGFVVIKVKTLDERPGPGLGAGTVMVSSQDEATDAIKALNAQLIEISTMRVLRAEGTPDPPLVVRYAGGGAQSDNIYITGLPSPQIDHAVLTELFLPIGTVRRAKPIPDMQGKGSSSAVVQLGSVFEAATAIEVLSGQPLSLSLENARLANRAQLPPMPAPMSPVDRGDLPNEPPQSGRAHTTGRWAPGRPEFDSSMIPPAPALSAEAAAALHQPPPLPEPPEPLGGRRSALASRPRAVRFDLELRYAGDGSPSDNLLLSRLPGPQVSHEALHSVFRQAGFGVRRSQTVPDTEGVGFSQAFVQMFSEAEAYAAIEALSGTDVAHLPPVQDFQPTHWDGEAEVPPHAPGRPISVKFSGNGAPSDQVFVSELPGPDVDQELLHRMFADAGCNVRRSHIMPEDEGYGGSAIVQLASVEDAHRAIELLDGRQFGDPVGEPPRKAARREQPRHTMTARYAGEGGVPTASVVVTGLPPDLDEATLPGFLATYGLFVRRCRFTEGSMGFLDAMVQLGSPEQAALALERLNGQPAGMPGDLSLPCTELVATGDAGGPQQGSQLVVRFASSASGGRATDTVHVSGLPSPEASEEVLRSLFRAVDCEIKRTKSIPDSTSSGSSCAVVQLFSEQEAVRAIELLNGRSLDPVRLAH